MILEKNINIKFEKIQFCQANIAEGSLGLEPPTAKNTSLKILCANHQTTQASSELVKDQFI